MAGAKLCGLQHPPPPPGECLACTQRREMECGFCLACVFSSKVYTFLYTLESAGSNRIGIWRFSCFQLFFWGGLFTIHFSIYPGNFFFRLLCGNETSHHRFARSRCGRRGNCIGSLLGRFTLTSAYSTEKSDRRLLMLNPFVWVFFGLFLV